MEWRSLEVVRLFNDDRSPRPNVVQLDVSGFHRFGAVGRGTEGPFQGAAADKLNHAEAFHQDAIRAIRQKALVIPNPFGAGELATRDVLVSPGEPWPSVPLFAYRFEADETFYLLKRGLSWCMDLGLFFPARSLLVTFQHEDIRIAQDRVDLEHAFRFFAKHRDEVSFSVLPAAPSNRSCVIVNSDHFAHHLWNELSVVEGIVAEGLHHDVLLLVSQSPLANLSALFPEIPRELIVDVGTAVDAPHLYAMRRSLFVAPTGRRFIPKQLTERILDCARTAFPEEAGRAANFRLHHDPIVWVTVRLEARTAINLVEALARALSVLVRRYRRLGVVFDGFTLPSGAPAGWSRQLIDAEARAVAAIVALVGTPFDYEVLAGQDTLAAFLWANAADYYICPHGTAQHKIAWINPVPGIVHAGDNKRPAAALDPAYHAVQRGAAPAFFYGRVVRADADPTDRRKDMFSYELDVEAFAASVENDMLSRGSHRAR